MVASGERNNKINMTSPPHFKVAESNLHGLTSAGIMAHGTFIHLHKHRWNCALLCGGGSSDRGGFCWHEALCQPNPSRSAYTPGGGGRQPGAALRIVETQYMQMSDCMSATLAVPCDKVIYKQSAQTARRATWCIYRRGDAPLGMVVCTISRVFVLEKQR